jgi:hypothetical protein
MHTDEHGFEQGRKTVLGELREFFRKGFEQKETRETKIFRFQKN